MTGHPFFLSGAVLVEIRGEEKERFFNIAGKKAYEIRGIRERADGSVVFWTRPGDFKAMKTAVKKTGVRLFILERRGFPFLLRRGRERKLSVCGAAAFFLLLFFCSLFIWDISFEGNARYTDEMLSHFLETIPVKNGMLKAGISCAELEEQVRTAFPDISWASAEIVGTRLTLHIKENDVILYEAVKEGEPCDLAAERAGEVVRIVMRSGVCKVKTGDQVEAGELLVDGTVPIYDDSETLIASHEVRADADIYARTVHTFQKSLPGLTTKKTATGKRRRGVFFRILGQEFTLLSPKLSPAGKRAGEDGAPSWEYVKETRQVKLFENFFLPVYYGSLTAREVSVYEKNYSKEELSALSERYLGEWTENFSEKGIQILGNDVKIEESVSGVRILGTMTVMENIALPVPAAESQEEIQDGS